MARVLEDQGRVKEAEVKDDKAFLGLAQPPTESHWSPPLNTLNPLSWGVWPALGRQVDAGDSSPCLQSRKEVGDLVPPSGILPLGYSLPNTPRDRVKGKPI